MVDFRSGQDGVIQHPPRVREGVPDPRKVGVAPITGPELRGVEASDRSNTLD